MSYVDEVLAQLKEKNASEPEFLQAAEEVLDSLRPVIDANEDLYRKEALLERICEPERQVKFRVPWVDDEGNVQVNTGYRVEFNSAIGPYKGGLRLHPSVNIGIIKFLGFEQIFKNSLTSLPIGGGREVGFMFGQYKKLKNEWTGTYTGKGQCWGGSLLRPEATGYGACYFAQDMLATRGKSFKDQTVVISGSGNVAQYAAEKAMRLGAKVVTFSDSNGYIYDPEGMTEEKIAYVKNLKNVIRGRIKEYVKQYPNAKYFEGERPWGVKCDIAMPCATQNEIELKDAEKLVANGCYCVTEGANMPTTPDAIALFQKNKMLYSPGKASNAGGVSTSGLEMSQNSMRLKWTAEEVDEKLHRIMSDIHAACVKYGTEEDGYINYVKGANIAGFIKVANAMCEQGLV